MHESAAFLASLEHDNPGRPRFRIEHAMDTQLVITFQGQSMALPISEVLAFASRWQADQDEQWAAAEPHSCLRRFPYPIYGVKMSDPDTPAWDVLPSGD